GRTSSRSRGRSATGTMHSDVPSVAALTHRLAECPGEFLEPALRQSGGAVHVDAIVADLVRVMGGQVLTAQDTGVFRQGRGNAPENRLQVILIAAWLLDDPWFAGQRQLADRVPGLLVNSLSAVAAVVPAAQFVTDPDRREELVRLCLAGLELRP